MKRRTLWAAARYIFTAVSLFCVWTVFAFPLNTFSFWAGIIGSFVTGLFSWNVFIAEHDASLKFILPRPFALIRFTAHLIAALYTSSTKMLISIISGTAQPRVIHFKTRLHSDLARTVLANSITFTPGTITLDLNDDHLTVHWFFCDSIHSKQAGETVKGMMEKYIRKVWP